MCDEDDEVRQQYAELVELFKRMQDLAAILRQKSVIAERGSIDFDFPEQKILVDEQGKPLEVKGI